MTVFEILKFNRELLERLHKVGVRLDDTRYIDLFVEFNDMVGAGDKVSYAVAVLADRYRVSERTVYALIKRYRSDCNALIFGGVIYILPIETACACPAGRCTVLAV